MSLANACNAVMLQTSSNGGYVTLATMSDPSQALSEQFCVARTYAMAQGEDLMGQITGLTQAQIAEQCASFSAMLSGEIDRVSLIETGRSPPRCRASPSKPGSHRRIWPPPAGSAWPWAMPRTTCAWPSDRR
jgi:hypothetical protein